VGKCEEADDACDEHYGASETHDRTEPFHPAVRMTTIDELVAEQARDDSARREQGCASIPHVRDVTLLLSECLLRQLEHPCLDLCHC
jgi:hypothetical protein